MNVKKSKLVEFYFYIIIILKIIDTTNLLPEDNFINFFMLGMGTIVLLYIVIKNGLKLQYTYPIELRLYIVCIIITLILNYNISTLKSTAYQLFYLIIIFLIAQKCLTIKIYNNITKIIVFFTFVLVTIFFIQYIIYRDNVLFRNINGGSLLVALSIMILILKKPSRKILYLINRFFLLYFIIFMGIAYSRTSILALILIVCIYILRKLLNIKYVRIIILLLLTLIMVLVVNDFVSKPGLENRITSLELTLNNVLSNRLYLWKYSIANLDDGHLLFGIGADLVGKIIGKMPTSILDTLSIAQRNILSRTNVHNGFIQILVQNGIIAFFIMIVFLYRSIKKMEVKDEHKYILLLIIVMNLCENTLILSNSLIVLVLWMILGAQNSNLYRKCM